MIEPMADFHLRRATERDRARIRRLIWRVHINPFGLDWRNFIVAVDAKGRFLGCGQLKPHGPRTRELASIAVVESARGRGVAQAIVARLTASGPRPLYLICLPELMPLYARFGFEEGDSRPLPPHFRRIRRFARFARLLRRSRAAVVMALD